MATARSFGGAGRRRAKVEGCCGGGRKRNGSCPVSRIWSPSGACAPLASEVIRAICARRSWQVDPRGRPGRDGIPALTSIRRPVARAHLTRINLETERPATLHGSGSSSRFPETCTHRLSLPPSLLFLLLSWRARLLPTDFRTRRRESFKENRYSFWLMLIDPSRIVRTIFIYVWSFLE